MLEGDYFWVYAEFRFLVSGVTARWQLDTQHENLPAPVQNLYLYYSIHIWPGTLKLVSWLMPYPGPGFQRFSLPYLLVSREPKRIVGK